MSGWPQAAVVGFAVTDALELIFDTLDTTRKVINLRREPRIAVVVGWEEGENEQTLQIEGIADEPTGAERERLVSVYLQKYPEGRDRQKWTGLTYVRVRPTWLRYSDFRPASQRIVELDQTQIAALASAKSP
jgi:hypothetical protein